MEKFDSGVNKYAIGIPSEEERKKLENEGYYLSQKGKTEDKKPYEIWAK